MHNIITLLFVQNICRFWLALMPQLILHNQQQIKTSVPSLSVKARGFPLASMGMNTLGYFPQKQGKKQTERNS